jgi:uncharacterized membrane protein
MFVTRRLGPGMMRGYDHGDMMDGAGGWFTMLLGLLVLLAVIGFTIYWVARVTGPRTTTAPSGPVPSAPRSPTAPSPRSVLDLRLARGEITAQEYGATTRLLDRSA